MTVSDYIIQKASTIKLLAMDVDGVLTNGELLYTDDGKEIKVFNVKDGHGIAMLIHSGLDVSLITGRTSSINQRRADELGIKYLFQDVKNKLYILESLARQLGLGLSEVAYIGDDTPDIPVLKVVGLAVCPSDAAKEVKRACHYTTKAPGGCGAVREVTDLLMKYRKAQSIETTSSIIGVSQT